MDRHTKAAKATGTTKRTVAETARKDERSGIRDIEKRLAEVLEQQAATSEILRVIASSQGESQSRIEDTVEAEPIGEITLKGIAQPVSVFNITGLKT